MIDSIHSDAFDLEEMSEEELKKLEEEFDRLRRVKQDDRNQDFSLILRNLNQSTAMKRRQGTDDRLRMRAIGLRIRFGSPVSRLRGQ